MYWKIPNSIQTEWILRILENFSYSFLPFLMGLHFDSVQKSFYRWWKMYFFFLVKFFSLDLTPLDFNVKFFWLFSPSTTSYNESQREMNKYSTSTAIPPAWIFFLYSPIREQTENQEFRQSGRKILALSSKTARDFRVGTWVKSKFHIFLSLECVQKIPQLPTKLLLNDTKFLLSNKHNGVFE